jgi:hypothetical protein
MNRWSRSRRDLLKKLGLGAAWLPLLHATKPLQAAPTFPKRLMIVLQTNGLPINIWDKTTSTTNLAEAPLPAPFTPLDPHKRDLIIFPALGNPAVKTAGHEAYGATFSGGPNNPGEYWTPQVPTLDQICADAVAKTAGASAAPPVRTLPLQMRADTDTRLGAIRCFFTGNNQPVTPEASPYKTADRLFAGKSMGDPVVDKLRAERRSILDYVRSDLESFGKNLGTEDRTSIAGHLDAVRQIEKQLSGLGGTQNASCDTAPALGTPLVLTAAENYPKILDLNFELSTAALRCDVTRIATLQLGNAYGGGVVFSFLGIDGKGLEYLGGPRGAWHDLAHREVDDGGKGCNVCEGTNHKQIVDRWFMSQFAALIERFRKVNEGGASMLDNGLILWANHMENGANHNAQRIPWMLAGKAGGYFKTNQLLKPSPQIQKTNVMCEIANAMGANLTHYGAPEYGGPLPQIRAG